MNFLRRMVDRAVERYMGHKQYTEDLMGHKQYTEDLMRAAGTFDKTTVQRIANGYVVYGSNTVMYCADHIAIADFIVAQATRNKMGVGTQMDLFEDTPKLNPRL